MSTEGGSKAVVAALVANAFIAVTKFAAWLLTGASSMLAEAIHSVADCGNQLLLLLGGRAARKPADAAHPFGYGRNLFVYSFLVAIVMFSVGGLFALYEAFHKYESMAEGHPDELLESQWWWVPLVVLALAIIAEARSLTVALGEGNRQRGTKSWTQFIREAKDPSVPVVLLEDIAALLGLVFALLGVGLTLLTHNPIFDVIGTALIGLLLVAVAIIMAIETKSLLLGEAATVEADQHVRSAIEANCEGVIHLRTMQLGGHEILVAAKIAVAPTDSAAEVAATIDRTEAAIRAAEPTARYVYLEPDLRRAGVSGVEA